MNRAADRTSRKNPACGLPCGWRAGGVRAHVRCQVFSINSPIFNPMFSAVGHTEGQAANMDLHKKQATARPTARHPHGKPHALSACFLTNRTHRTPYVRARAGARVWAQARMCGRARPHAHARVFTPTRISKKREGQGMISFAGLFFCGGAA